MKSGCILSRLTDMIGSLIKFGNESLVKISRRRNVTTVIAHPPVCYDLGIGTKSCSSFFLNNIITYVNYYRCSENWAVMTVVTSLGIF